MATSYWHSGCFYNFRERPAPFVKFRRKQANASKTNSSDSSGSHSSHLLGVRLGSGFAFVKVHDPSFDKRPPEDAGPYRPSSTDLGGAEGNAGLGEGVRTLLAAVGFAPRRLVRFPPSSAMFPTRRFCASPVGL